MVEGEWVWLIAHIRANLINTIDGDIEKSLYPYIRPSIPKIRILKKQFKGSQYFDEVPLLFNYGFFKMPYNEACNLSILDYLKANINGIHSWLFKRYKTPNPLKVYTLEEEEVIRLMHLSKYESIYNGSSITEKMIGSIVSLKGYPFDNMSGELLSINPKREEAKVRLMLGDITRDVIISFGNLFYSAYEDFYGMELDSDKFVGLNYNIYGSETGSLDDTDEG